MMKQEGGGDDGNNGGGRKRGNNDGGDHNAPQKRSFINDPEAIYLKFLVPQATAGSVIGKGGSNISDLQKEYNVHIRMSKANDVFPGSDSRVALMSGKVGNVLTATMVIFKRMTSPSDLFPKNPRPKTISDKEISLIVPQSTAGLIIGKGGSRVKGIQEETKCHINLTQKTDHIPSNERVVTIQNNDADHDNIEKALKLILEIIKSDPGSGSCLQINYSHGENERSGPGGRHNARREDFNDDYYEEPRGGGGRGNWDRGGGGGGGNGGGGGGLMGSGSAPRVNPGINSDVGLSSNSSIGGTSGYPPQVHFWCTFSGPPIANGHTPPPHMIEGMKSYLLNVGYPPKAVQEIVGASNILASYGVLKPGNIAIFNTPLPQQSVNPFSAMAGNGAEIGADSAWNNNGLFNMNKFNQGGGGVSRGGGYDSSFMSGMGGGGMNSGMGGGYGKGDMNDGKKQFGNGGSGGQRGFPNKFQWHKGKNNGD